MLERSNEQIVIKAGDNKVIIKAAPLKVEFYQGDNLASVVNGRGLFVFEHVRAKKVEG